MPGAALGQRLAPLHPAYVRITHWINAVAILAMIGSGWEIYNASPLFRFEFPKSVTLGGWLAGALLWHFAAMWLLVGNGLVYVLLGLASGQFRRKWLPLRPADFMRDLRAALTGRLAHGDLTVYNAVQKALYIGVMLAGVVSVASGLAIWKPVQLRGLAVVFGGYEAARLVHFFAMAAIVAFIVLHVVMAVIVPKTLRAIIVGR
jgi:thiosulfate reductase cytochrome b subunit